MSSAALAPAVLAAPVRPVVPGVPMFRCDSLARLGLLLLHLADQSIEAVLGDDLVEHRAVVLDQADAVGLDVPGAQLVAVLDQHVVDRDRVRPAAALSV